MVTDGINSVSTNRLNESSLNRRYTKLTFPECDITLKTHVGNVMRLCETVNVTCERVEITSMLHVIRENYPRFNS